MIVPLDAFWHVIEEADLSDWKTGGGKQLKVCVEGESDWE
jgi:hypothetical protein